MLWLTLGTCGLNSTALCIASTAAISAGLNPLFAAISGENLGKKNKGNSPQKDADSSVHASRWTHFGIDISSPSGISRPREWAGWEREREARERSTHITFLVPLPDKALPFSKTKWWGEGRWGCWSPPLDLSLASCPIKPPNNCASWLKQTARTITMIRTNWTGWGRL